jgi:hypothetical protein
MKLVHQVLMLLVKHSQKREEDLTTRTRQDLRFSCIKQGRHQSFSSHRCPVHHPFISHTRNAVAAVVPLVHGLGALVDKNARWC